MNTHACPICHRPWRCWIPGCGLDLVAACPNCPNTEDQSKIQRQEVITNATQSNGKRPVSTL